MSKVQNLANAIADYLAGHPRTSREIHSRYLAKGPLAVTAALRLLVDDKRAVRERVKGQKGFLYKPRNLISVEERLADIRAQKAAVVARAQKAERAAKADPKVTVEFDDARRTWAVKPSQKALDEIKADPGPVVITKDDIKAVGWQVTVPSASEGFEDWWKTSGPFSTPLWAGAPKSTEMLAYMETYRREAHAAWVSAATHFCPLAKAGLAWEKTTTAWPQAIRDLKATTPQPVDASRTPQ